MTRISESLLEIMECPVAHVSLVQVGDWLYSTDPETRRKYPIRDGIPIMLIEESVVADPAEFEQAMAFIDIAAMETRPMARRFEVYGSRGSAIIAEPFEPGTRIRLCLEEAREGYVEGEQEVKVEGMGRMELYGLELGYFWQRFNKKARRPDPWSTN